MVFKIKRNASVKHFQKFVAGKPISIIAIYCLNMLISVKINGNGFNLERDKINFHIESMWERPTGHENYITHLSYTKNNFEVNERDS